jgi:diguanylate cyclase (GGDEF)-like protein
MNYKLYNPAYAQLDLGADILDDASPKNKVQNNLVGKAYIDSLTGLLNRTYIEDVKDDMRKKGNEFQGICCAMIDLNGLKQVNDVHGHAGGNILLERFGKELSLRIPENYIVSRIGGDEFFIISDNDDLEGFEKLISNIKIELNQINPFENDADESLKQFRLNFAHGCAALEEDEDVSMWETRSDLEMYFNKAKMKNIPLDPKTQMSYDLMKLRQGRFAKGFKKSDLPKDEEGKIIRGGAPRMN